MERLRIAKSYSRRIAWFSDPGEYPGPPSSVSCGSNVIHECHRTAASTRTGTPTVADLVESIRTNQPSSSLGLLAVERKAAGDVIGYCGLVDSGRGSDREPELALELLRRVWRQGYATEASSAVLDWARSSGYERVLATLWEWNTASRRVLAKLGFTETDWTEVDPVRGTTLFTMRQLGHR